MKGQGKERALGLIPTLLCGVSAVGVVLLVLLEVLPPKSPDSAAAVESQFDRLLRDNRDLSVAFQKMEHFVSVSFGDLEARIAGLAGRRGLQAQTSIADQEDNTKHGRPDNGDLVLGRNPSESAEWLWLTVLDKEIGGALVERGLTPYSPGIAEFVVEAARKLRQADQDFQSQLQAPRADLLNGLLRAPDFQSIKNTFAFERKEKRREAITAFVGALEGQKVTH